MLRDVVERHNVSNVASLRWMVRHLLGNAAAPFSVERFYQSLRSQGFAVSKDTIFQLLAYLEDCFLVRTVWMEADSERQRMANPRKGYPIDSGLIPVFERNDRANLGHALETAVLVELERRRFDVTYVKTPERYEVDFLARSPTGKIELIQVAARLEDAATLQREQRALAVAGEMFPQATKRLLTLTGDPLPGTRLPGIIVQPGYEWFLTPPE
jgi:predicted AAA+ superfamily ATPase